MESRTEPPSSDAGPPPSVGELDHSRESVPNVVSSGAANPAEVRPARSGAARLRSPSTAVLLGVGGLLLSALLLVPLALLLARGYVFGADWSEYLYSGPSLLSGARPLFLYPYPVLPLAYWPVEELLGNSSLTPVYLAEVVSALLVVGAFYAGFFACRAATGSDRAGLVGAVAVGAFPLLQLEIAWGGQAQLLAYDLGFLALGLVISRVLPRLSLRHSLVAGALLAVAALSEPYSTSVVLVSVLFLLVLVARRRLLSVAGLTASSSILAPPILATLALTALLPAAANPAGGVELWELWRYAPIYSQLWSYLTLGSAVVAVADIGLVCAYVGFRALYRARSAVAAWLVPATGASALLVGLFLTPALDWYRSVYALVFPFAFAVSELASLSPAIAREPRRYPRWRRQGDRLSRALPLFAVASLLLTGAQLGADVQDYPNSLATYSFSQGEISELFFLNHEPGAVLYDVAPIDHMFVDLWATGRPIYPGPSFEPYTVTSAAKQNAVILGTSLSYGDAWIDDGPVVVTEAGTDWGQPNPGLLLFKDAHTFVSIESNDFADSVRYSPESDPTRTFTAPLFNSSETTVPTPDGLETQFAFNGFSATRSVTVDRSGTIDWNYTFAFTNATPRSATVYVTDPFQVPTTGGLVTNFSTSSAALLSQTLDESPLPPLYENYSIDASTTGATLSSGYTPRDTYGIFRLSYVLVPATPSTHSFSVDLAIRPEGSGSIAPVVHTEAAILAETGIRWVVLSRSSSQLLIQRFMDDPEFVLYRETPHFYVLTLA